MPSALSHQSQQAHLNDLLAVANSRDRDAFTRLFDHFVPLLRGFILSAQPGSTTIASEITQEVMLKVWRKAHTFNPESASVSTWIYTLARNARIDYLRKNGKHQSDIDPEYLYNDLVDHDADPFTLVQQRRHEDRVKEIVSELPESQQAVLAKVYMEGKSHSEVAVDLNLPLGTVKSRVRLALKKLSISVKRP